MLLKEFLDALASLDVALVCLLVEKVVNMVQDFKSKSIERSEHSRGSLVVNVIITLAL